MSTPIIPTRAHFFIARGSAIGGEEIKGGHLAILGTLAVKKRVGANRLSRLTKAYAAGGE